MKLLDWLLAPAPAQQFVNNHAEQLRSLLLPDTDKLAELLEKCSFHEASQFIWQMDDITRSRIPQRTWSFLLSMS